MKQVRVGVIGTSWWPDSMYLLSLDHHPLVTVVAFCGRNREPAEAFAQSWKISAIYTDWQKILAEDSLDAIVITTANSIHASISVEALRRGQHVLCEKPVALYHAQAKEMSDLANSALESGYFGASASSATTASVSITSPDRLV